MVESSPVYTVVCIDCSNFDTNCTCQPRHTWSATEDFCNDLPRSRWFNLLSQGPVSALLDIPKILPSNFEEPNQIDAPKPFHSTPTMGWDNTPTVGTAPTVETTLSMLSMMSMDESTLREWTPPPPRQTASGQSAFSSNKLLSMNSPPSAGSSMEKLKTAATKGLQELEQPVLVAIMARPESTVEDLGNFLGPEANRVDLVAQGTVSFHGDMRLLIIVCWNRHTSRIPCPSQQLNKLIPLIQKWLDATPMLPGPTVWPLHSAERLGVMLKSASVDPNAPAWSQVLMYLGIDISQSDRLSSVVTDQYGKSVSFGFSFHRYTVQMLWFLAMTAVPFLFLQAFLTFGTQLQVLIQSAVVFIWGCIGYCRPSFMPALPGDENYSYEFLTDSFMLSQFRRYNYRRLWFFFLGLPVLLLYFVFILILNSLFVQLLVHVIYIWGDCVNLCCRDPSIKHGVPGILVEICADIFLAIVWEILYALSSALANWLASLWHFRHRTSEDYFAHMLETLLQSGDKALVFMIFAIVFVPQWQKPVALPRGVCADLSIDCSDLFWYKIFGNSSIFCLSRRLQVNFRRSVFARSLKGPFCVAPFIGILVKAIVPYLVRQIDGCSRKVSSRWRLCRYSCAAWFFIVRFFALIFCYDGESVGCLRFVFFGWPFSDVEVCCTESSQNLGRKQRSIEARESKDDEIADQKVLLDKSLLQAVRKPFEPADECTELRLTWLWMLFFVPIAPWGSVGVVTTLAANWLELKSDLLKLLFVRRRLYSPWTGLIRKEQFEFVRASLFSCLGWYFALCLITYNDELHSWDNVVRGGPGAACAALALWITLCFLLSFGRLKQLDKRLARRSSTRSTRAAIVNRPSEDLDVRKT